VELTIHQIGDFGWFSEKKTIGSSYRNVLHALREHIKYVEKKAELIFGSVSQIFAKAKSELEKRWDSRVALKFWVAVPKDWQGEEALERVVAFVSKELDVPPEHITAFFHAHENNPHVHIVLYPRNSEGRKLNITRRKLKEFHRAWDKYLESLGYEIKRFYKASVNIPNWLLHKDAELKELYEEYVKLRNEIDSEMRQYIEQREEEWFLKISDEEIDEAFREENKPLKRLLSVFNKEEREFKEKQKNEVALQLKALGFSKNDKIAVVLVAKGKKPLQRITSVEKLLDERFLAFLRAKNSEGYNIYITLNRLKPSAKGRKASDFEEEQNKIYLDIDGEKHGVDGMKLLGKIIAENNLPQPTLVVRTSRQNVQAVWVLDSYEEYAKLEAVMKELAKKYGLDHTQDIARVFRLAGFYNRKEGKNNFVYIAKPSNLRRVSFEHFRRFVKAEEIEEKRKEVKSLIKRRLQKFEYSSFLDKYKRAIEEVFAIPKLQEYKESALKEFDKLAKQVISNERIFKSASEFELALVHAVRRALKYDFAPTELRKLLFEVFEQVLERVRKEKLERNKKYVKLTVDKALNFDEDLLESLAPDVGIKLERIGKQFFVKAWNEKYKGLKIKTLLDIVYYEQQGLDIAEVFELAERLKEKAKFKEKLEDFEKKLEEKTEELFEKALEEFAKEERLSGKETKKLKELLSQSSAFKIKLRIAKREALSEYRRTSDEEEAFRTYEQSIKEIAILETYYDLKEELDKFREQEYEKMLRNYKSAFNPSRRKGKGKGFKP